MYAHALRVQRLAEAIEEQIKHAKSKEEVDRILSSTGKEVLDNAGTISLKAYNETNDRYFTRNTLNTQGLGIQFRKEFERWSDQFRFTR